MSIFIFTLIVIVVMSLIVKDLVGAVVAAKDRGRYVKAIMLGVVALALGVMVVAIAITYIQIVYGILT